MNAINVYGQVSKLITLERYSEALSILEGMSSFGHARFAYAKMRCLHKLGRLEEALACCDLVETTFSDTGVSLFIGEDRSIATRPKYEKDTGES